MVHRFLSFWEIVKLFHGRSDVFHISPMELDRARVLRDSLAAKTARSKAEAATFLSTLFQGSSSPIAFPSPLLQSADVLKSVETARARFSGARAPSGFFAGQEKRWRTGVRHRVEDELLRPQLLLQEESEG
jgi:hypothetical protein